MLRKRNILLLIFLMLIIVSSTGIATWTIINDLPITNPVYDSDAILNNDDYVYVSEYDTVYDGTSHIPYINDDIKDVVDLYYREKGSSGSYIKVNDDNSNAPVNAGEYDFKVVPHEQNIEDIIEKTFKINPRSVTVKANDVSSAYGTPLKTNGGYTLSGDSILSEDAEGFEFTTVNISSVVNSSSVVGTYPNAIDVNYNVNDNYIVTVEKGTYTITSGTIDTSSFNFVDTTVSYNGTRSTAASKQMFSISNLPAGVEATYTYNGEPFDGAIYPGTYSVSVTYTLTDENYTLSSTSETVEFTIEKAVVSRYSPNKISFEKVYDGTPFNKIPGLILDVDYIYTEAYDYSSDDLKNVGSFIITVSLAETDNYLAYSEDFEITIIKATPSISDVSVIYNQSDFYKSFFTNLMNVNDIEFNYTSLYPGTSNVVPGTMKYSDTREKLSIGKHNYEYTFTPEDTRNYEVVTGTVEIETFALVAYYIDNEYSDTITVKYNSLLKGAYNPKLEGHSVEKWYKDIDLTIEWDIDSERVVDNIELYGQWSVNYYTVTFIDRGNVISTSTLAYGTTIPVPPEHDYVGYEFIGWDSDGDGMADSIPTTMPAANMTFEAIWYPINYNIEYTLNGGSPTGNPSTYTINSSDIILNNPTRTGYTFDGWIGTGLEEPTITVVIPTGSTGNRTYTAKWKAEEFTITYNLAGGSVSGNPTTYTVESGDITLVNPTRENYTFDGWIGTGLEEATINVVIPTGSTGNRTYTAKWTADTEIITLNSGHVKLAYESITYSGVENKPDVTVEINGTTLKEDVDYSVTYEKNIEYGTARVTISILEDSQLYAGEVTVPFLILTRKLTPVLSEIAYKDSEGALNVRRKWKEFKSDAIQFIKFEDENGNIVYLDNEVLELKSINDNKYSYSGDITDNVVGSTYLATIGFKNSMQSNRNNEILADTLILKYMTAYTTIKGEGTWCTIEDAITNGTGTITLAGNAEDAATYVTTAFSSLTDDQGYPYNSRIFTLIGRTLVVPYDNTFEGNLRSETDITPKGASLIGSSTGNAILGFKKGESKSGGNVYSALYVNEDVVVNISETSNLVAAAFISYNQPYTTVACNRGVIVNDGEINIDGTSNVASYGYIKGIGVINIASGGVGYDAVNILDWIGGTNGSKLYSTVFPTSAWSMHHNACETNIYAGAIYKGVVNVYMSSMGMTAQALEYVTIIGDKTSGNCVFGNVSANGSNEYIKKKADSAAIWEEQGNPKDEYLSSITGIHHEPGQKDIFEINGNYENREFKVNIELVITVNMVSSTSISLPLAYMDVIVKSGTNLSLSKSDFLILPGCKVEVESNANVTIGAGVDVVALDKDTAANYYFGKTASWGTRYIDVDVPAKIIINGNVTVEGAIGGYITTTVPGAKLDITSGSASGTYITLSTIETTVTNSIFASAEVYTSAQNYETQNLSKKVYYSTGNAWRLSTTGTISYNLNGGTSDAISAQTITIINGLLAGFTILETNITDVIPTRPYYEFDAWYIDEECTIPAINQTIYDDVILYAKWDPIGYNITYVIDDYDTTDTTRFPTEYTSENASVVLPNVQSMIREGYTFAGWYLDQGYSTPVSIIDENVFDPTGNVTDISIYGKWIEVTEDNVIVTIKFECNMEGKSIQSVDYLKDAINSFNPASYNSFETVENVDQEFEYYLDGWYIDEAFQTEFTTENLLAMIGDENIEITLYAKWNPKYIVNFYDDDTNGNLISQQLLAAGSSAIPPKNPTKTGYTFTNWDKSYSNVSSNLDIYPEFTPITYTITYTNIDGATHSNPTSYTVETETFQLVAPDKTGYTFDGWTWEDQATPTTEVTITQGSTGNKSYTANWTAKSSGGGCLAEGTQITLADGSKKNVEDITSSDLLIVFNHETGKYDVAKVLFNDTEPYANYNVINLEFSNDSIVKVVFEHGFFNLNLNKYVYITEDNYLEYVGHSFVASTYIDGEIVQSIVTLDRAYITEEYIRIYSPVTEYHLNYITEDILSMPGGVEGIFNIFEYDDNLKYDEELMKQDIETYGLFTYEDFKDLVSEEIYDSFPTQYFKVAIGKGLLTLDNLYYYIERYVPLM